jgi:hypothetical protein
LRNRRPRWRRRIAILGILPDGVANDAAPVVGVVSVDVFVLGVLDGLEESLGEIGNGAGSFGFYITTNESGDQATKGSGEIAGGDVWSGKKIGKILAEFFCGESLGFPAEVVGTEARTAAGERATALTAIGKGETTQGRAVLSRERGHGCLLRLSFAIC